MQPISNDRCHERYRTAHPWCTPYRVSPAPRHEDLAMEALDGIADMMGEKITETTFLRIVTTRQGRMTVFYSAEGVLLGAKTGGISEALGRFLFDLEELSEEIKDPGEVVEPPTKDPGEVVEPPTKEGMIEILPESSLAALGRLLKGSNREHAARLNALLTDIETKGLAFKPLAKMPASPVIPTSFLESFPNFAEFFDYLNSQAALASFGQGVFAIPPVLLVGEPGTGKTEVASRLAAYFGTDFLKLDMAVAQTGASLAGIDVVYSNTRQGMIFNQLVHGSTANPIVMLDEIDKISYFSDSPTGALYTLLEKKSAASYYDQSLPGVFLDARHIVWIATANATKPIDPALLSRFRVFHIPTPTKAQMPAIINSVYGELVRNESWGAAFPPEIPESLYDTLESLPPRDVCKVLKDAFGLAAKSGRRELLPEDITPPSSGTKRIGF